MVLNVLRAVFFVLLLFLLYVQIKNRNTYNKHKIIVDAIYFHNLDVIRNKGKEEDWIKYTSMEPYETTLFRLWDWGYKNIVDKQTYQKIEPYIRSGNVENKPN